MPLHATLTLDKTALKELRSDANSETLLTLGEKLCLSKVEIYDLELISGVSDVTAQAIIESRAAVIERAQSLKLGEHYRAFEIVHGIGPKKAKLLASRIDPLR